MIEYQQKLGYGEFSYDYGKCMWLVDFFDEYIDSSSYIDYWSIK